MLCDHEYTISITHQYDHCLVCGEVICNGNILEEADNGN